MTESLAAKIKELRQMLLDSEEYKNFDLYRRVLMEAPDLYKKVLEFRSENFNLQLSGEIQNKEKAGHIVAKYQEVFNNSLVTPYLNAELVLCKMLQDVTHLLIEDIDVDVDFLK